MSPKPATRLSRIQPPRIREAVRALLLDDDDNVLLVRWELGPASVWGTPGGGIEPDEPAELALRRELAEEVGLLDYELGALVWERTHMVAFINGLWDGQHDRFFVIRHDHFEPRPQLSADQLRAEHLAEMRWWSPAELAAFVPSDREFFAPRRLPALLDRLRLDGPPPTPIDTGV